MLIRNKLLLFIIKYDSILDSADCAQRKALSKRYGYEMTWPANTAVSHRSQPPSRENASSGREQ